jgi:transformation/transcription domain-associated protein
MNSLEDVWRLRQQFSVQYAMHSFFSYVMFLNSKHPTKWCLSCHSGRVYVAEVTPSYTPQTLQLESSEPVPFRLTPNFQHFMTPQGIQGLFVPTLMYVGRALAEKGADIESLMCLFMRDDLFHLVQSSNRPTSTSQPPLYSPQQDPIYREKAMANSNAILKRIQVLSCMHNESFDIKSSPVEETQPINPPSSSPSSAPSSESLHPADALILQLIAAATNPWLIAQTELSGYPWF